MEDVPEMLYAAIGRTVIAMDRFSGRPVWRVKLPRFLGGNISMLLPHGDEVYISRGSYIYCLDRRNGAVLWERGTDASGSFVLLSVAGSDSSQQQVNAVRAAIAAQQQAAAASSVAVTAAASASS